MKARQPGRWRGGERSRGTCPGPVESKGRGIQHCDKKRVEGSRVDEGKVKSPIFVRLRTERMVMSPQAKWRSQEKQQLIGGCEFRGLICKWRHLWMGLEKLM